VKELKDKVSALSVDWGKIRLRAEEKGEWRDYKAVSLHESVGEAFFQDPQALQQWSERQPLGSGSLVQTGMLLVFTLCKMVNM